MDQKFKQIKKEDITLVLEYLPYFENKKNKFYKVALDLSAREPYIYSDKVLEFVRTLRDYNFVQPEAFDAAPWGKDGERILNNDALLAQADLESIVKLFTYIVVKERTTSGNLAILISNGTIAKILKRLGQIKEQI